MSEKTKHLPVSDELTDDIRIPLHSLQADMKYLFGRVLEDPSCVGAMLESIHQRLSQIEEAIKSFRRAHSLPSAVTDEMVNAAYEAGSDAMRNCTTADIGAGEFERVLRAGLSAALTLPIAKPDDIA